MNLSELIRKEQLPQMKQYMSEDDYLFYEHLLVTNWSGLKVLDEQIIPRMFGYENKQHYYESVSIAERVTNIRVPTFALGAADD